MFCADNTIWLICGGFSRCSTWWWCWAFLPWWLGLAAWLTISFWRIWLVSKKTLFFCLLLGPVSFCLYYLDSQSCVSLLTGAMSLIHRFLDKCCSWNPCTGLQPTCFFVWSKIGIILKCSLSCCSLLFSHVSLIFLGLWAPVIVFVTAVSCLLQ